MEKFWTAVQVAIAGLAGFWFGLHGAFKAMMLLQFIDIVTGMWVASQSDDPDKRLSSSIAMRGVRRKGLAWAVVGVVYVLETYLAIGMNVSLAGFTPAAALAGYFAVTEGLSIVENADRAGVPIPDFVRNLLAQQRNKLDGTEGK